MNIGIIAYAHSGYTKFLPALAKSIKAQTVKPQQVTFVVDEPTKCKNILKGIKYKEILTERITMGAARNLAIENTPTEWIMYMSADDVLIESSIESISKHQKENPEAEVISISYSIEENKTVGYYNPGPVRVNSILDESFYCTTAPFYIAFSPFKRSLWEKIKYIDHDFPNAPFWIDLALLGAKFTNTEEPCAIYKRRPDSHSRQVKDRKPLEQHIQSYRKDERHYTPTLSIFSIVRDEEQMCREAWDSVKDADELVVVIDKRTTDKTPEIAKEYTDNFDWEEHGESFAAAKNFAMSKCNSDWIMGIDADCTLKTGIDSIRKGIEVTKKQMLWVTQHKLPKVFRNGLVKYEGMAHEYPIGGELDNKDYGIEIEYDYSPNHKKDPDRYIRILTRAVKREPHQGRWKYYLGREYSIKRQAENGRRSKDSNRVVS